MKSQHKLLPPAQTVQPYAMYNDKNVYTDSLPHPWEPNPAEVQHRAPLIAHSNLATHNSVYMQKLDPVTPPGMMTPLVTPLHSVKTPNMISPQYGSSMPGEKGSVETWPTRGHRFHVDPTPYISWGLSFVGAPSSMGIFSFFKSINK